MAASGTEDEPSGEPDSRFVRLLHSPVLLPLLTTAILILAAVVIYRGTHGIHWRDIRAGLAAVPMSTALLAAGFAALSYAAMAAYDVLSCRAAGIRTVSTRLAAFAGATGFAISNTLGFQLFTGGSIRMRIYRAAGLDVGDIGRIVAVSLLGIWFGLVVVIGVALLFDPAGIPWLHRQLPLSDRLAGVVILALLAGFLALLPRMRTVSILGWRLQLPGRRIAVAQLVAGAIDFSAAAACLYVLMPSDIGIGFAQFSVVFVLAATIGAVSHTPGGLGVFEAGILFGLGLHDRADAVAALLAYRVIYYLIPFALGGLAFAIFEMRVTGARLVPAARGLVRRTSPFVSRFLTALVFFGGLVLLLSGSFPAEHGRIRELRDLLPLPFTETSYMLASLTGLLLIVLARGLYNRLDLARRAVTALLIAGAAFSLLKGLDWEEATILVAIAAALQLYRGAFYRHGDWREFRPSPEWLTLVFAAIVSITLIGMFAFRHVEYRTELWWQFAWHGDASRFLRVTVALGIATAALAIDAILNQPLPVRPARVPIPKSVRRLLAQCPDTQPQIALLGDKSFLVSADESAFLMYAVSGKSLVTMGGPVGSQDGGRELIWRFAEIADRAGRRPVFYGLTPAMVPTYLDFGQAILKIGEVARVDLPAFDLEGPQKRDLRYAQRRASRDGLKFEVIPKESVGNHLEELRLVSDAWLDFKNGSEKGFSLGRFEGGYVKEFDCAVMRQEGRIVAFANLWRGADLNELSVDLMRYRRGVSNILMEAFFVELILYGKEQGYRWFNLGAAPLAGLVDHPLASTWNRLGTMIYRRGDEFFNFEGLRNFKQQFGPVWTPQYVACPGGLRIPQVLMDIAALISGRDFLLHRR